MRFLPLLLLAGCPAIGPNGLAERQDLDGDGYVSDQFQGDDCDDHDGSVHPDAEDEPYDDRDADCSGGSDFDGDGDGYDTALNGGDDCDDTNPEVHPGATEACDGLDADCDGTTAASAMDESDRDADGWLVCADDCEDTDADVHPDALESCNERDDDCDGLIDADDPDVDPTETVWYRDEDLDGFGAGSSITTCAASDGYTHAGDDCDDTDGAIYPGAEEVCDVEDNDCDGAIDDDDADIADQTTWFRDADGDLYGDADDAVLLCFAPDGYVADDLDCDDTDLAVSPAAGEVCDTLDNDCDGATDDDDDSVAPGDVTYTDADADGFGDPSTATDVCAPPESNVADSSDCDDSDGAVFPGAVEGWYDGVDQDCSSTSDFDQDGDGDDSDAWGGGDCDDVDPTIASTALEVWYDGVDADCDGWDDFDQDMDGYVSVDWAGDDCGDTDPTVSPEGQEDCSTAADDDCDGDTNPQGAIGCVAFYADADADGYGGSVTDCFCAATTEYPNADSDDCDDADDAISPAEAEVCKDGVDNDCDGGPGVCGISDLGLGDSDAKYAGVAESDQAYEVAGVGDMNADGFGDFVVGASSEDSAGTNAGAAYLILGSATATSGSLASTSAMFTGEAGSDYAGNSVAGVGDFDGDGFDDLGIGAHGNGDGGLRAGAAYVVLGSASPASGSLSSFALQFTGEASEDAAGQVVSGGGDFNDDGYTDLWIAGTGNDDAGTQAGAAYLVLGSSAPGSATLSAAIRFTGESSYAAYYGLNVGHAGDVDGDGLADGVIAFIYTAAVYLVLGTPTPVSTSVSLADATYVGESSSDGVGYGLSSAGDVNADGYGDVLVSASSQGADDQGHVYLILGSESPTSADLEAGDVIFEGEAADDYVTNVGGPGDVDADGFDDVLVGSGKQTSEQGAAYLILGSALPASASLAEATAKFSGSAASDRAGDSVSGAGDVNADGYMDLLVGVSGDDEGASNAGAAHLILGNGW